ncbi:hypothetical protein S83_021696 [Arachis hypogaea]
MRRNLGRLQNPEPSMKIQQIQQRSLAFWEENPETSMFLIHLPEALPAIKGSASSGGQVDSESSSKPQGSMKKVKPCKLNELPPGFMGKMLVYKSGAIKLKVLNVSIAFPI